MTTQTIMKLYNGVDKKKNTIVDFRQKQLTIDCQEQTIKAKKNWLS